ncbi:germinal-center associated nuclear protein-like, partial [Styela clava]
MSFGNWMNKNQVQDIPPVPPGSGLFSSPLAPTQPSVFGAFKQSGESSNAGTSTGLGSLQSSSLFSTEQSGRLSNTSSSSTFGSNFGVQSSQGNVVGNTPSLFGTSPRQQTSVGSVFGQFGTTNDSEKPFQQAAVTEKRDPSVSSLFGDVKSTSSVFGKSGSSFSHTHTSQEQTVATTSHSFTLFQQNKTNNTASSLFGSNRTQTSSLGSSNIFGTISKPSSFLSDSQTTAEKSHSTGIFGTSQSLSDNKLQANPRQSVIGRLPVQPSIYGKRRSHIEEVGNTAETSNTGISKPQIKKTYGRARFGEAPTASYLQGNIQRKRSYDQDTTQESLKSSPESHVEVVEASRKKRTMQISQNPAFHQMLVGYKKKLAKQRGDEPDITRQDNLSGRAIAQPQFSRARARRSSSSSNLIDQSAALQSSAIICHNVPPDLIDNRDLLRNHFEKFGQILRININAEKNTATVVFKTHEEAAAAKTEGAHVQQSDSPMKIFFSKRARKSVDKSPTQLSESQNLKVTYQSGHKTLARVATQQGNSARFPPKNRVFAQIFANTDEEKLGILEKIDNLLRKKVVRQSDIKKAKTSIGTCPDMCPEKERYLRQQRKLLSAYEMEGGLVCHYKAVKEYSRSSADQEEPLPHELRPASVLQMTMHYILLNMMPKLNEGQVADWFDFVWNRTRAIRKELTIQQFSDVTAVHINEECARFHIFCAHHLCEEDRMVFDPKINNENLEKTMKTIMDLYHDVYFSPAQGQAAVPLDNSNVAEMYGYYILLNINKTADVLNELQELPPEVRYSSDVGFAVQAFMAVHSNNYAKFFKVVRRATFMQGCILHRYFMQVRKQAASTICKAFVVQSNKRTVLFPADDFMKILSFNDMKEVGIFCQHFGIEIDANNMLLLNRNGLEEPDSSMAESRSNQVLDKIQGQSLAKLIAKRDIAPIHHEPYSSFDKDGRYIGEHTSLLTSGKMSGFQAVPKPDILEHMKPAIKLALPPGVTNDHVKILARELFHEVIDETALEMAKEMHEAATCTVIGKNVMEEVLNDLITDTATQMKKSVHDEKEKELKQKREREEQKRKEELLRKEEQRKIALKELEEKLERERIAKEKEEMKLQQTEIIATQLQTEVEDDIINTVAEDTCKEVLREHRIELLAKEEFVKITADVTFSMLKKLCNDTYKEDKKKQCHSIFCEIQTRKLERLFNKWIKVKAVKVKFQNITTTFPSVPYSRKIGDQVKFLLPNQKPFSLIRKRSSFPLDSTAEASLRSPMEIMSSRKRCKTYFSVTTEKLSEMYRKASEPLLFCDLLNDAASGESFWQDGSHFTKDVLWKIAVYFPENNDESELQNWVETAFLKENEEICLFEGNKSPKRDVCCRRISNNSQRSDLMGTSSIVLILSKPPTHRTMYWTQARSNLEFLISTKPSIPTIPLVIVLLDWELDEDALAYELGLPLLDFALSDWASCSLHRGQENVLMNYNKLTSCVKFLFQRSPDRPILTSVNLLDFFENTLSSEYVTPLYHHISNRQKSGMYPLDPASQIDFYNFAIESLAGVANSEEFIEISWPPPEFVEPGKTTELPIPGWNSNEKLLQHYESMQRCKVPCFPIIADDITENEIFEIVAKYAEDVCPSCPTLLSSLKHGINAELQRLSYEVDIFNDNDESGTFSLSKMFDWHKVIDFIISQHLTNLLYYGELGNIEITFPSDILDSVEKHPGFDTLFRETHFQTLNEIENVTEPKAMQQTICGVEDFSQNEVISKCEKNTNDSTSWIKKENNITNTVKETQDLRDKVKYEQKINAEYEERLKAILEEGEASLGILDSSTVSAS